MKSSPSLAAPDRFWVVRFGWAVPLACGALVGIALRLFFSGTPGKPYAAMESSLTLLVPILVGAVTVYAAEHTSRRSWAYYYFAAAAANALFVIGTMVIRVEGLICAVLAVPLGVHLILLPKVTVGLALFHRVRVGNSRIYKGFQVGILL